MESDARLARRLQEEEEKAMSASYRASISSKVLPTMSPVDPEWETLDPNPDLHSLFVEFNAAYFWGQLVSCEVKWSPRMTTCAGICRYSPREGHCSIGMSTPLLKLRPRKDMVETLLHEMIHAYLFVTQNNRDRDGHGPEFHKHMYRINAATGASISVYHTFHDEVALYKQHWWRCNGPCTKKPPFYGFVKRAMNRAPGPSDRWWGQHMAACGGTFVKVKEPEKHVKTKEVAGKGKGVNGRNKGQRDIRDLIKGKENKVGGRQKRKGLEDSNMVKDKQIGNGVSSIGGLNSSNTKPSVIGGGSSRAGGGPGAQGGGGRGNIFGFGGTSFEGPDGGKGGGLITTGKVGTVVVKPGWKTPSDNSSGGSVVNHGGGSIRGGFKLGSSSSSSNSSSVKDVLRKKWGSPGGSKSTSTPGPEPAQSSKFPVTKVKPPGGRYKDETDADPSHSQSEKQQCPVCSKYFPAEEINPHLDLVCLADAGNNSDQAFDDDVSDTRRNSSRISIHSISDSDDDEPLIKRTCDDQRKEKMGKGETVEEENLFGDTTLQDDLDLLAALEDVTMGKDEGDASMFACPVCDTLLNHTAMNEHLDVCIS